MRCLGRMTGCLLLNLILMAAPTAIWTVVFWDNVLTSVDEYTMTLNDEAYADMSIFVIPGVALMAGEGELDNGNDDEAFAMRIFGQVLLSISRQDLQDIVGDRIPAEWTRETLNRNLNTVITYTDFETNQLDLEFDLLPVYEAINTENGDAIERQTFAALEELDGCSQRELDTIDDILARRSESPVPDCRPDSDRITALRDQFNLGRNLLVSRLEDLPDFRVSIREQIVMNEDVQQLEQYDEGAHDTRRIIFFIDQVLPVILITPMMLFAMLVVVTVRSAKGFFLWASLALIGTSILTIFPLVPWIYGLFVESPGGSSFTTSNNPELELSFAISSVLFSAFSATILVSVSIMAFVGIGFLLLAALLRLPDLSTPQQVYYVVQGQSGNYPIQPATGSTPVYMPATPQGGSTPAQPAGSSAADRHKEELSRPDVPEDQTFIPPSDTSDRP